MTDRTQKLHAPAMKTALPSYTTTGVTMDSREHPREGGFMAAEVWGCGRAHHLFHEVSYMEGAPQVHLHFLTDHEEFKQDGFGRVEIVCHGCGASMLVYYNGTGASVRLRDRFKKLHLGCANRGYEARCPNYRSSTQVIDLRRKAPHGPRRAKRR